MESLLYNFLLYATFFIIAFKAKRLTIYNVSILWFAVIAFFGYYSYVTGAYTEIFWNTGKFLMMPYLLCFFAIVILLEPWRKYNKELHLESLHELEEKNLYLFCKILLVTNILLAFVFLFKAVEISTSERTLADIYDEYHEEGLSVLKYSNVESKIVWLLNPLRLSFYWFVIFVSLLKINKNDNNSTFWRMSIFFTVVPDILIYIIRSARGEILYLSIEFIILFVILWPYLSKKSKKEVILASTVIGIFFSSFTLAISESRFDDSNSSQNSSNSIIRYFGEAYPNLSNQLWDKVLIHPMGTRMMPYVAGNIVDNNVVSVQDQHIFWESVTGVPMLNFKTIYGDFYIEFGKVGGLIAIAVISLFFLLVFRKKKIPFFILPLYGVYVKIIVLAPLFFSYRGTNQFLNFTYCLLASCFIKVFLYRKSEQNQKLQ